jgi:hypothetical protein
MHRHLISSLLATAIVAGCAPDAPTPVAVEDAAHLSRAASQGKDRVPFKARVEGRTESLRVSPDLLLVDFEGSGQATHLGRTQVAASLEVDEFFAFTGEVTLRGADGSQLIGTVSGQLLLREFPIFDVVGNYEITGGTRRFAGASGSGTIVGELDFEADQASIELSGTVSSVGTLRGRAR